jgi:hypothetical protein
VIQAFAARGSCCDEISQLLVVMKEIARNIYHTATRYKELARSFSSSSLKTTAHKMVATTAHKYMAPKYAVIDPLDIPYSPAEALVVSTSGCI